MPSTACGFHTGLLTSYGPIRAFETLAPACLVPTRPVTVVVVNQKCELNSEVFQI